MRLFEGKFVDLANSEGMLDPSLIPQLVDVALISPERLGCSEDDRQEIIKNILQSQSSWFGTKSFVVQLVFCLLHRAFILFCFLEQEGAGESL